MSVLRLPRELRNADRNKERDPSCDDVRTKTESETIQRVQWVDYAKGWSIVLVVSMHSALGVGLALDKIGWLHPVVAFAKPFRMPDFFLIAGLFLGRAIDWPLRAYLDRKVIHFVYFFALWTFIILAVKSGELGLIEPRAFLNAFFWALVEPFSSLWFVQLLPILFVAVRLARDVPPFVQVAVAAVLHFVAARHPDGGLYAMSSNMTGWMAIDTFSLFLVYFLIGHHARAAVFLFAAWVARRRAWAIVGLAAWAFIQTSAISFGLTEVAGLTLIFGLLGGFAVVAIASLMANANIASWIAYCGHHSLPIYLAFALPMAATRVLLIRTEIVSNPGWASLIVTAAAIIASLGLEAAVRSTWLSFLFVRPTWARLRFTDHNIRGEPAH